MSRYIGYGHSEWVQDNIRGSKRQATTARDRKRALEHRGWIAAPDTLTFFQRRAFDILGVVGGGIYNCPIVWNTIYWMPKQLIITWRGGFGTWDFHELTMFTFLCHVARIRGYIGPYQRHSMQVFLSERKPHGDSATRHPNLEQALKDFHRWYPQDHRITYPGDKPNRHLTPKQHNPTWPKISHLIKGDI